MQAKVTIFLHDAQMARLAARGSIKEARRPRRPGLLGWLRRKLWG